MPVTIKGVGEQDFFVIQHHTTLPAEDGDEFEYQDDAEALRFILDSIANSELNTDRFYEMGEDRRVAVLQTELLHFHEASCYQCDYVCYGAYRGNGPYYDVLVQRVPKLQKIVAVMKRGPQYCAFRGFTHILRQMERMGVKIKWFIVGRFAAKRGDLELLRHATGKHTEQLEHRRALHKDHENFNGQLEEYYDGCFFEACRKAHLPVLRWLLEEKKCFTLENKQYSNVHDKTIMQYLLEHGMKTSAFEMTAGYVMKHGTPDTLDWMIDNNITTEERITMLMPMYAHVCRVEILDWYLTKFNKELDVSFLEVLPYTLQMAQFIYERFRNKDILVNEWSNRHTRAWKKCSLELLDYVLQIGVKLNSTAIACIAEKGLPYLRCVVEHGLSIPSEALTVAAKKGDFEMVQFAFEHGALITDETLSAAVSSKNLFILNFCIENGGRFSEGTFLSAIETNDSSMMIRLIDSGCPIPSMESIIEQLRGRTWVPTEECTRFLYERNMVDIKFLDEIHMDMSYEIWSGNSDLSTESEYSSNYYSDNSNGSVVSECGRMSGKTITYTDYRKHHKWTKEAIVKAKYLDWYDNEFKPSIE